MSNNIEIHLLDQNFQYNQIHDGALPSHSILPCTRLVATKKIAMESSWKDKIILVPLGC
jgi:hypothetical protein